MAQLALTIGKRCMDCLTKQSLAFRSVRVVTGLARGFFHRIAGVRRTESGTWTVTAGAHPCPGNLQEGFGTRRVRLMAREAGVLQKGRMLS